MVDNASEGHRMLRRIGTQDVDLCVFQDGSRFEIEATMDGRTVKLEGKNLVSMAKELARRLGLDQDHIRH